MAEIEGTCPACGRTGRLTSTRFVRVVGVGLRVLRSDRLLLACDSCQRQAGFTPVLVTALLGWWALPKGPAATRAALRDNLAQLGRYGAEGSRRGSLAMLVAAVAGGAWVFTVVLAVAWLGVSRLLAPDEAPPSLIAQIDRAAEVRARAASVPLGLADGSEPPAHEAAAVVLADAQRMMPSARVGVRVDVVRRRPAPGEIAGAIERVEVVLHVAGANAIPVEQLRLLVRSATLTLRARLGDGLVRARVLGADGRGPGAVLRPGESSPEDLEVADTAAQPVGARRP